MPVEIEIESLNRLGAASSLLVTGHDQVSSIQLSTDASEFEGNGNWAREQGKPMARLTIKGNKGAEVKAILEDSGITIADQHPKTFSDKDSQGYIDVLPSQLGDALGALRMGPEIELVDALQAHALKRRNTFVQKLTDDDVKTLQTTDLMPPAEPFTSGVKNDTNWAERVNTTIRGVMRR